MKNVVILGSWGSGLSIPAACLSRAGYFMGESLAAVLPHKKETGYGLYEDDAIVRLNRDILNDAMLNRKTLELLRSSGPGRAAVDPLERERIGGVSYRPLYASDLWREKVFYLCGKQPFCFKDPRFSLTLPFWQIPLEGALRICVFREPQFCAASLMRRGIACSEAEAICCDAANAETQAEKHLAIWIFMYQHILSYVVRERTSEQWFFIHFRDFFSIRGIHALEKTLGIYVSPKEVHFRKDTENGEDEIPGPAQAIYQTLKRYAKYCVLS
ncbi:MAG: hypothetical protein ACOY3K_05050 [Candidatus Omnitrophota bacterium]